MKNKVKNLWRIIFLIILSFSLISCTVTTSSTDYNIEEKIVETANFMQETIPDPTVSSIGGDWTIMSLARSDIEIHKDYFENYYDNVVNILEENQGILHERKYTEYSRAILALTAIGKDPSRCSWI